MRSPPCLNLMLRPRDACAAFGCAALLALSGSCTAPGAQSSALTRDPALAEALARDTAVSEPSGDSSAPAVLRLAGVRRRPDRRPALSPLADTIARSLVFLGRRDDWFTAAARGKRLLLDLGRVDTKVKEPARYAAYLEAVAVLSPVRKGDRFRVHGPWGADSAIINGYDVWNGRIVATLDVPARVNALVRRTAPLVAAAVRTDSAVVTVADTCDRDSLLTDELLTLVSLARDSIEQALRPDSAKLYERLQASIRVTSSVVTGCFADARALLLVTMLAGDYEYVRESAVLVSDSGQVVPLKAWDPRFRAHEALHALDADGDGVDDIATRGYTTRAGSTVVMRLNRLEGRLERLTGGFAWEYF
jgi:hypothetical protein